jgi:nitroreductase
MIKIFKKIIWEIKYINFINWIIISYLFTFSTYFKVIYKWIKANRNNNYNFYNLKRNIHRIEKALIFEDRKDIFAEWYIWETVKSLNELIEQNILDKGNLHYFISILDKYFSVVKLTWDIIESYNIFLSIRNKFDIETDFYLPFKKSDLNLNFWYEDFLLLAKKRRSVRFYCDKKVEEIKIKKAVKIAEQSPSACNRQSFYFKIISPDKIDRLSDLAWWIKWYKVPNLIAVIWDYSWYFDERDFKAPIIDSSLASMWLLYWFEIQWISSICINWSNNKNRDMNSKKLLWLKDTEFIVMLIWFWYADKEWLIPYSCKNNLLK